jgi:ribosome-associated toxin RatA of RatAB toxin-antitoxin module
MSVNGPTKALRIEESIVIQASRERVFDFTQDYSTRLRWDSFLKKAELLDAAGAAGKGVQAWCVARNGIGMVTEYVTFNRPEVTAIKMTRGPFLFKSFAGSWRFRPQGEGGTEVVFLYSFTLRFPFSLLSNRIRRNLQRNVRQRLADLKFTLEQIDNKS